MYNNGYQMYREQSINTMTSEELLLMLYDELMKRLTKAELTLEAKDFTTYEESVQRAIDIIKYLDETLDHKYEISHSLTRLYEYFIYELGRAKIGRNKEPLMRIKRMSGELRDTFREAQKNSSSGR